MASPFVPPVSSYVQAGMLRAHPALATPRGRCLQRSPLFLGLTLDDCEAIASRARERHVTRTEILYRQGQPSREITLMETGCLKLTHVQSNGDELILSLRTSCEVLDPSAITRGDHRMTAQAMLDSTLLCWTLSTMDSLLPSYPQLSRNLQSLIVRDLAELQERYCELTSDKLDRRLACALIRLAERIGTRAETGGVRVQISRQELAQMVGTTLFSVSRLIARWGELGLVSPGRETIVVLKPRRLIELTAEHDEL